MRITSSLLLTALLLSSASSSVACRSPVINTQDSNATQRNAGGVDDSSAPAGWKRYDFEKPIAFSLTLPSQPEQRASTATESSSLYISTSSSGVYGLTYINDLPALAGRSEESGHEFFFNTFVKDFAMKLQDSGQEKSGDLHFEQFKVIKDGPVVVSGLEGLEWSFSIGSFQGRARVARLGQAGLCQIAIWKQTASPAEQDAFFSSFKIKGEGPSN